MMFGAAISSIVPIPGSCRCRCSSRGAEGCLAPTAGPSDECPNLKFIGYKNLTKKSWQTYWRNLVGGTEERLSIFRPHHVPWFSSRQSFNVSKTCSLSHRSDLEKKLCSNLCLISASALPLGPSLLSGGSGLVVSSRVSSSSS